MKLSFKSEEEIKTWGKKKKVRSISSRLVLQEMLKEVLQAKKKKKRYKSETWIYIKKRVAKGINENKIKSFFLILY